MDQSNLYQNTLHPHYKPGTVFERDEAFYTQIPNSSRRIANNLQASSSRRQPLLLKSRSNAGQQSFASPNRFGESRTLIQNQDNPYANTLQYSQSNTFIAQPDSNPFYLQAVEENKALKRQMDELLNGSNDFGNSSNVVTLQHYSRSQQEAAILQEQEQKIAKLEQTLKSNEERINDYKRGSQELQVRMNSIQSIDREIYKTLQGSVNRDKELLDRASSALARGERREDIAKVLQQIIAP